MEKVISAGGCAGRTRRTPGEVGELDGYSSFHHRGRVSRVPGAKEMTSLFRFLLFDANRPRSFRFIPLRSTRVPSGQSDKLRVEKAAAAEVLPLRCIAVRHACCVDEPKGAIV